MKKNNFFWFFLIFLTFFSYSLHSQEESRKNPFSVEWDDSVQSLKRGEKYELKIRFHVPNGFFLYHDKTTIDLTQLGGLVQLQKKSPKPEKRFDPFFKKETEVYFHDFEISYLFKIPSNLDLGRQTLEGEIRYQGCSNDFCYSPQKMNLMIPVEIVAVSKSPESAPVKAAIESRPLQKEKPVFIPSNSTSVKKNSSIWSVLREGKLEQLGELNRFLLAFIVFLAGLLTDLTPCVLPIIPLTLAVVGIQKQRSLLKNFSLSLSLVVGISVTYACLGLLSSLLGLRLGFLFQSRYFLGFLILFYLLMGLGLLGVIRFQLPLSARNFFGKMGGSGYVGSFLAGLTLGFIASPCVGPLMGPLLLLVAQGQSLWWGAMLLFIYGLGMGMIFLIGGTFYSSFGSKIRGGNYTQIIQKILAVFILLPAIYYGSILYSQFRGISDSKGWKHSLSEGFEIAKKENKPILIDFYADWCLPCLEIDRKTFHHPKVEEELQKIVPIKIDCTLESSFCSEAVNRFQVVGWPTILFLDKNQNLQKDLSVVGGFVGPERMLELLETLKKR